MSLTPHQIYVAVNVKFNDIKVEIAILVVLNF